jgi:dTDP-4-amino-4,6-dideoxygalactose transaminase
VAPDPGIHSRILLSPPDVGPQDRVALLEAFDSGWIAPSGPEITAFEQEIAERVGVRRAVALTSGTAALHLALLCLDVGAGDDVLCPSATFVATGNAISYVGANPIFIDSSAATWTIDPQLVQDTIVFRARSHRTPRALVTVDLYGQCADYDPLLELCERYGVALVEDAAEALGSTYRGRQAGAFGAAGVFSFNGNKIITTSGGGMLVTNRDDLADRAAYLATQARDPVDHYEHRAVGHNYRLSSLLAALGRQQLRALDQKIAARRHTYDVYLDALQELPGVQLMPMAAYGDSNCWLTCLTVNPREAGLTRTDLIAELASVGIEARPTWKPMHLQPVFGGATVVGGAVSEMIFERGLCLPSGSSLTDEDRERVVDAVQTCVRRHAHGAA